MVFLPFFAAIAVALAILPFVGAQRWSEMLRRASPIAPGYCPLCILSLAVVPMAALRWTLPQGSATRLTLTSAMAG